MTPSDGPHPLGPPEGQLQTLARRGLLDRGRAVVRLRRHPLVDGGHRTPADGAADRSGVVRRYVQPLPRRGHRPAGQGLGRGLHLRRRQLARRYGLQTQPVLLAAHLPQAAQARAQTRGRLGPRQGRQGAPALLRRHPPLHPGADRDRHRRAQPAGGQGRDGPDRASSRPTATTCCCTAASTPCCGTTRTPSRRRCAA